MKLENVVPWGRNLDEYKNMFLLSEQDLQFHIDSILEMCRVAKKEVRIFPLLDLKNNKSEYLKPILKTLQNKGFKTEIVKTTESIF